MKISFRSFYYDLQTNSVIFTMVVVPRSNFNSVEFLSSRSLPFPDSESFSNDLIVPRYSLPHRIVLARRAGLVGQGRTDRKYFPGIRGCRDNPPLVRFDVFYFGRAGLESKPEWIGPDFLESLFWRRQGPK